MTFLQYLKSRKGSLIRLKTKIYWYDGSHYDSDDHPNRISPLIDVNELKTGQLCWGDDITGITQCNGHSAVIVFLLIDGLVQRICVGENDVEFLNPSHNPDD